MFLIHTNIRGLICESLWMCTIIFEWLTSTDGSTEARAEFLKRVIPTVCKETTFKYQKKKCERKDPSTIMMYSKSQRYNLYSKTLKDVRVTVYKTAFT